MTLRFPPSARVLALTRAALDLDGCLLRAIVRESIEEIGVVATWEQLVRPVWEHLASRPDNAGGSPGAEHFYARTAYEVLANAGRTPHEDRARRS